MLILASTSKYRAELLNRLGLAFESCDPAAPELEESGESPGARAERLALDKAIAVAKTHPEAVVIGSDQVAAVDGEILHKPGNLANAVEQLQRMSGKAVEFHTALAVVDASGKHHKAVDITTAHLRHLSNDEIDRYLKADQPFDCAGSFKVEALGISLFESVKTDEPTALIGLPLIELCKILRRCGVAVP